MDLSQLRRNYLLHGLDESEADPSPVQQLLLWLQQAQQASPGDWFEPNAMSLSTSWSSGEVSSRIVLLKRLDANGITFFTNYKSAKGEQLLQNPRAACVFYWPHLERQVRIEGSVQRTSDAESDEYFAQRPRESQLSAWASEQSRHVISRKELEAALDNVQERFANRAVTRPQHWGGYRLIPHRFEFWQGRPSRLHDRILYARPVNSDWTITRLAP